MRSNTDPYKRTMKRSFGAFGSLGETCCFSYQHEGYIANLLDITNQWTRNVAEQAMNTNAKLKDMWLLRS